MTFHPETSAHFGPRDCVAILRRRLRMILFAIGTVLAALLLVDPTQKNHLAPDEARQTSGITESVRVESEIEIARSGAVMLTTVEREGLASDAEFGPSISTTDKLRAAIGLPMSEPPTGQSLLNGTLHRLAEATDVRRRGLTYVFAISVASESPDRAARLVNAVAQTYIDLQIETKTRSLEAARTYAQLGKSVALIDADPLSSTWGVVGRGRSDVPTDQLLMSREFQLLLKNAREAMDVIIVDTSPLNSAVDAQFIAPLADAAVIRVRFGETSQRDLRLAHQRLVEGLRDDVPVVAALNQEAGRMTAYDETGYYSY